MMDFADIPFVRSLGLELLVCEGGHSEVRFPTRPEHMNSFGITHGGACMALLDVALARAARSVAPELGIVTIEMKTSFLRPAKGVLLGKGRLLHRTHTLAFTEGSIVDARGRVCAHATGTFRYLSPAPEAGAPASPTND